MGPEASESNHGQAMQRRIVEASRELCDERGDAGLTIRSIAARVGVSSTVLYRCFACKSSILGELRRDGHDRLDACLRGALEREKTGRERFFWVCDRYLDFAFAHPRLYDLMFEDGPVHLGESEHTGTPAFIETLARCFAEDGRIAGRVEDLHPIGAAAQLCAALHGLVGLMRRFGVTPATRPELVQSYVGMLAHALTIGHPVAPEQSFGRTQAVTAAASR